MTLEDLSQAYFWTKDYESILSELAPSSILVRRFHDEAKRLNLIPERK